MPCSCVTNCLSSKNRNVCECRAKQEKCGEFCSCGEEISCSNGKCYAENKQQKRGKSLRGVNVEKAKTNSRQTTVDAVSVTFENNEPPSQTLEKQQVLGQESSTTGCLEDDLNVSDLTLAEMKLILTKIKNEHPHIHLRHFLESEDVQDQLWEKEVDNILSNDTNGNPPPPAPGSGDTGFRCKCHNCRPMPTQLEKKCCARRLGEICLTNHCNFNNVILNREVLEVQMELRQNLLHLLLEDGDNNKRYRHAAYRQYIYWQWGKLGAGNRRVIPSCVVWKIRDTYPNPNGVYTGYKQNRFL